MKLILDGTPGDPRQTRRRYLCLGVFLTGFVDTGPRRGLLDARFEGVDRDLLTRAIRATLATDDGLVRSQVGALYDKLGESELDALWPNIVAAIERRAPSGEMFAEEIRVAGVQLLAKQRIREGMKICVDYARNQNPWGSESRMAEILGMLRSYGTAAKEVLPELRQLLAYCRTEEDFPEDCKKRKAAAVEEAIAFVESAKKTLELRSIAHRLPGGKVGK